MNSSFTSWLNDELSELEAHSVRRHRRSVSHLPHGRARIGERELISFSTNDYLGLRSDERVVNAFQDAAGEHGAGAGASPLVSGRSRLHEELESELCRFETAESALLFPTGFAANLGTLTAIARPGDTVFCERLNHASLVDGCRYSEANLKVFRHTELDRLEQRLSRGSDGRQFIITDTVFSMDATYAPLEQLADISERHDAILIVDEAHATGVAGTNGSGLVCETGLQDRCDIRLGTLSKAVGLLGGFLIGPSELTEFVFNQARTQFFSTALPPAVCAAAIVAIDIIQREPSLRTHVHSLASDLRSRLEKLGIPCLGETECPIVPILVGEADVTVELSRRLEDKGYLVPAIRPPTVPERTSRLRVSLSAAHSSADIHGFVDELADIWSSLGCTIHEHLNKDSA